MKKYALIIVALIFLVSVASAPGKQPSHPLSQIHPIDEDFNMSNMRIFNVSRLSVNGGLKIDGNQILDSGANPIVDYRDGQQKLELVNTDLGTSDNNITGVNNVSFSKSLKVYGGKVWIPENNKYGYFYRKNITEVLEDGTNVSKYDIQMNGQDLKQLDEIRTDGSGSDNVAVRDTANGQDIVRFNEGGTVEVPNEDLNLENNEIEFLGDNRWHVGGAGNEGVGVRIIGTSGPEFKFRADGSDYKTAELRIGASGSTGVSLDADGRSIFRGGDVEVTNGNLDIAGNNITNIDWLKFEEGTSIDGNLTVNGSVETSGDIDMQDNNIYDANNVETNAIYDPEDGRILVNDDINLNNHIVDNADYVQGGNGQDIELTGDDVDIRDTSNNDIIRAKDDGNVDIPSGRLDVRNARLSGDGSQTYLSTRSAGEGVWIQTDAGNTNALHAESSGNINIPSGNLDMQGNRVVDTTGSDTVYVGDANSNTVNVEAGGSGDFNVNTGDEGSGTTRRLTVTSSSGEADVDVQSSDVDLNGNSVTTSTGEVCIGDQCA